MIRFRTIDPAEAAKPADKPAEKPAMSAGPGALAAAESEPVSEASTKPKGQGMTRKTPLRTKKPEPAKLFDN